MSRPLFSKKTFKIFVFEFQAIIAPYITNNLSELRFYLFNEELELWCSFRLLLEKEGPCEP